MEYFRFLQNPWRAVGIRQNPLESQESHRILENPKELLRPVGFLAILYPWELRMPQTLKESVGTPPNPSGS